MPESQRLSGSLQLSTDVPVSSGRIQPSVAGYRVRIRGTGRTRMVSAGVAPLSYPSCATSAEAPALGQPAFKRPHRVAESRAARLGSPSDFREITSGPPLNGSRRWSKSACLRRRVAMAEVERPRARLACRRQLETTAHNLATSHCRIEARTPEFDWVPLADRGADTGADEARHDPILSTNRAPSETWYRIPDSARIVSCVSPAFIEYIQEAHETQETGSIRVQIRVLATTSRVRPA